MINMSQRVKSVVVSPMINNPRISVINSRNIGRATIVDKRRSTVRGSVFKLSIDDRREVNDRSKIDIIQKDSFSK
jgi:spore cortex formation protein SpoVR/YcgB (stage V sporulation)